MSTTAPRLLRVLHRTDLTPRMVRVTLGGDELAGFPGHGPDRRIRMFFPAPGQDRPAIPRATSGGPLWPPGQARPAMRTYTVRRYDDAAGELDVDFVQHPGHGPAAAWARDAVPGSWVGVSEPGGRFELDTGADYLLVIGDETALPAVATILKAMPVGMAALALLEIADAGEEQLLPGEVAPTWVHRDGRIPGEPLAAAVRSAVLPDGAGQAWLSGEAGCVRDLRLHLLNERGFDRGKVYATGYWRAR